MSGFVGYNETICMRLYGRGLKREMGLSIFLTSENHIITLQLSTWTNNQIWIARRHQQSVSGRFYLSVELPGETTDEHHYF